MPAIDVVRENGHLKLRVDVPGIKPEEMTIEVEDDTLSVSGRHEETSEEQGEEFIRRERRSGSSSAVSHCPWASTPTDPGGDPRWRTGGDDPDPRAGGWGASQHHAAKHGIGVADGARRHGSRRVRAPAGTTAGFPQSATELTG